MSVPRPRLQTLIFEVTTRCNHACRHCYNVWQPAGSYPTGEMDTAATLAMLERVLDAVECEHVTLTGGEPLLRDDLLQVLDLLHARRVRSTLISNGRLLTRPLIVELLARGVSLFELPLLSQQRTLHDALCGAPGAFDAVVDAMAEIRLQRGRFAAAYVLTARNADDVHATGRLAYALGARALMLNRFNPGGRGRVHLDELLPTVEQVRDALAAAERLAVEYRLPVACSIPIQPCLVEPGDYPHLGFGFCAAGTELAYYALDPLGNMRPCNHTPTVLGNVLREPVAELLDPARLADFVVARPAFCAPCALVERCQGGCKAAAQVCYGSLWEEEPFLRQNRAQALPLV